MNPQDKTDPAQTESISFEFELAHAPAKVWRALTDPSLLEQWLLPVIDFRLAPEAAFRFKAPPQAGWNGDVNCKLIEIDEHRKLSYSWAVGDMELETLVTFTLTPAGSGTRLSLVQSGFKPHQKQAWGGARYGWKMMGERLVALLGSTA